MSVFFRKLRINDSTGTATIIVTDKPISSKLNAGDEMPGFQLSDNPVVDLKTGEETNLRWVEQDDGPSEAVKSLDAFEQKTVEA